MRKTAAVFCPGRGTYNAPELGYIGRHHSYDHPWLRSMDAQAKAIGFDAPTDLDASEKFDAQYYSRGEVASSLIFSSSVLDFSVISNDKVEVVAVSGNSMGWYSALACAGVLSAEDAFGATILMSDLFRKHPLGGQVILLPTIKDWLLPDGFWDPLYRAMNEVSAKSDDYVCASVIVGNALVVAGTDAGLRALEALIKSKQLTATSYRLPNHSAFHSELQRGVSDAAKSATLDTSLNKAFENPQVPLIDGRGKINMPFATSMDDLWDYTFGEQVVATYNFNKAVQIVAKEFAPDYFVATGPGNGLGAAIAQALIAISWDGISSKSEFIERQAANPVVVSMSMASQRALVV